VQVSPELRDFICKLLEKDVLKRLDIQGALQVCLPLTLHSAGVWMVCRTALTAIGNSQVYDRMECWPSLPSHPGWRLIVMLTVADHARVWAAWGCLALIIICFIPSSVVWAFAAVVCCSTLG
jgi:hypothetical protein